MAVKSKDQQKQFWQRYIKGELLTKVPSGPPRKKVQVGRMYQYSYRSKLYHQRPRKLPYYDAFPLVIIIGLYSDGWLGLSLHYLPPKMRKALVKKILIMNSKRLLNKGGPIKLPYSDIKNIFNLMFRAGSVIIKRYLRPRVKGPAVEVPWTQWYQIASLESAQWKGATKTEVYADTRQSVKKARKKSYNKRFRSKPTKPKKRTRRKK